MVLVVCMGLAACVSGARIDGEAQPIDTSTLLAAPERYSGVAVRVHACVNVTFHGITLVVCGAENPQINIESGEGVKAMQAYSRLTEFAHRQMGQEPEDLPVTVEGIYRSERVQGAYRHTIYMTDFRPEQRSGDRH